MSSGLASCRRQGACWLGLGWPAVSSVLWVRKASVGFVESIMVIGGKLLVAPRAHLCNTHTAHTNLCHSDTDLPSPCFLLSSARGLSVFLVSRNLLLVPAHFSLFSFSLMCASFCLFRI